MSDQFAPKALCISEVLHSIGAEFSWHYNPMNRPSSKDVMAACEQALLSPLDFPSIIDAIVPGDRVALAVDPNLPEIDNVLRGVIRTLEHTDASEINVVLWDEATDATTTRLQETLGKSASVLKHESSLRDSMRYLGADKAALPVYVNRALVDADFVLPIIPLRPMDAAAGHDLTGIFPSLTDSKTRKRFFDGLDVEGHLDDESQVAWWLGVQMLLCISTNSTAKVCEAFAGTPEAIRKRSSSARTHDHSVASLVIASLDGGEQQQTWANATRAIVAASQFTEIGGVIVAWTHICRPPQRALLKLDEIHMDNELSDPDSEIESADAEEDFGKWDESVAQSRALAKVVSEFRVMIHCNLDREQIEPMGFGVVGDTSELTKLMKASKSCGLITTAQFAGSSHNKVTGQNAKTKH